MCFCLSVAGWLSLVSCVYSDIDNAALAKLHEAGRSTHLLFFTLLPIYKAYKPHDTLVLAQAQQMH